MNDKQKARRKKWAEKKADEIMDSTLYCAGDHDLRVDKHYLEVWEEIKADLIKLII